MLERILVIPDSADSRTHRLIAALRSPDRLITVLGSSGGDIPGVEAVSGVEDVLHWLAGRYGAFDVVIVCGPRNWEWAARAIDTCQPLAMRVYDTSSLAGRQDPSPYRELEASFEATAFAWADAGVCANQDDVDWVAREIAPPTLLHVVGYSAAVAEVRNFSSRSGVASFGPYSPSLLTEVWPALRTPDLRLSIVDADAPADPDVDVIGHVPDASWWRGRALLHLAPADTPGLHPTLIESMAAGLPFVTTPLGAEGLHLGRLAETLVSTSTADMVAQATKLLTDRSLWIDVQDQLVDLAEGYFSPSVFRRTVDDALLSCGLAPGAATYR